MWVARPLWKPVAPAAPPNPYVGPRAFRDGERLFGRDREAGELLDILISQRVVLLHSPSGAGKTSLVEAAIRPALREDGFVVHPTIRVNLPPQPGDDPARRFVLSSVRSLRADANGGAGALTEALPARALEGGQGSEVLIIDQLEEVLTTESATELGRLARAAWFSQLGAVLEDRRRWALLCIREDYLAELEPFLDALPRRLRVRYRLDLLETRAAAEAIRGPAAAVGVDLSCEPDAARGLLDNLATVSIYRFGAWQHDEGRYVEPVQLQVVCQELWNHLPWTDLREPDGRYLIPAGAVGEHAGQVDNALERYYDRTIAEVAAGTVRTADQPLAARGMDAVAAERRLREWIDANLITEQNTRRPVPVGSTEANELGDATIEGLEDAHLVRGDERSGTRWLELAHDRLVAPVRASNEEWYRQHLQPFQLQARLWDQRERDPALLLTMAALAAAETWLAGNAAPLRPYEEQFLTASRERRRELDATRARELRQRRRLRRAAAVATAFAVIAVLAAVFAVKSWIDAIELSNAATAAHLVDGATGALAGGETDRAALLAVLARGYDDDSNNAFSLLVTSTLARFPFALVGNPVGEPRGGRFWTIAVDPAGGRIFAGNEDGTITIATVGDEVTPVGEVRAPGSVRSLALSPDGSLLAAGLCENKQQDGTCGASRVAVYTGSGSTWTPAFDLAGNTAGVRAVAFDPADPNLLISVGRDSLIRVWDLEQRATRTMIGVPAAGGITALAISPDGSLFAVGLCQNRPNPDVCADKRDDSGKEGTVLIYALAGIDQAPAALTLTDAPVGGITTLAFSPDGTALVAGGGDGTIRRWAIDSALDRKAEPPRAARIGRHRDAVTALSFDRAGQRIISSGWDGELRVWDLNGSSVQVHRFSADVLYALVYDPSGRFLLGGGNGGLLTSWEAPQIDGTLGTVLASDTTLVWDAAVTADQSIVVATGEGYQGEGATLVWTVADGHPAVTTLSAASPAAALRADPPKEPPTVWSLGISRDGRCVAAGDDRGGLVIWRFPERRPVFAESSATESLVRALEMAPDGSYVVTGQWDGTVNRWDVDCHTEPGAAVAPRPLLTDVPHGSVRAVAFSADGGLMTVGGCKRLSKVVGVCQGGGFIAMVDPATGAAGNFCCAGDEAGLVPYTISFSPDASFLAAGTLNGSILVWCDPRRLAGGSGALVDPDFVLRQHALSVRSLAFNPTGTLLLSGSDDGTALLWNLAGWQCDQDIQAPFAVWDADRTGENPIRATGWFDDGRSIFLGFESGEIAMFTVDPDVLLGNLCSRVGRNPSDDDWRGYVQEGWPERIATWVGLRPDPGSVCTDALAGTQPEPAATSPPRS